MDSSIRRPVEMPPAKRICTAKRIPKNNNPNYVAVDRWVSLSVTLMQM